MKDRPILFNAPMVRALLDGSKTQTRRIVKLPHQNPLGQWEPVTIGGPDGGRKADGSTIPEQGAIWHTRTGDTIASPYGQPGDRLWVRETFYALGRWETRFNAKKGRDEWHFVDLTLETDHAYCYPGDGVEPALLGISRYSGVFPVWWTRPAIFMPRAASRITLEITGVRVERLQDISEADAIAEGCTKNHSGYYWGGPHPVSGLKQLATATKAYRDLWGSINGPESWDANPWVWVVQFKVVKP